MTFPRWLSYSNTHKKQLNTFFHAWMSKLISKYSVVFYGMELFIHALYDYLNLTQILHIYHITAIIDMLAETHFNIKKPYQQNRNSHHNPDSKVHGTNMGPTWVLSAPDGPHVGPMNLAIREDKEVTSVYPKNFHDSSDICPMGLIYSFQICEIFHQTFGPRHRKCLMCPMIFVNTVTWLIYLYD